MLQDVSVNGISIGSAAIVSIPVDTVDLAIHATFVASTAVGGLQVLSERDTPGSQAFARRIAVLRIIFLAFRLFLRRKALQLQSL
jgi:hypothetical protein